VAFCTFEEMKVVVNARWLLPGKLEGTGIYTLRMLEHITEALPQIEFTLLYDRPSAAKNPLIHRKNITHRTVLPPARHPWLWHIWNRWAVPHILWRESADLYWSPDGLPARTSAQQWITIHDLNFEHHPEWLPTRVAAYYKKEIREAAHSANQLFTVSEWSREDIAERYGVSSEEIIVTPNASQRIFSPGPKERLPYFCAVGAMTPRKNLKTLLEAFDAFKQKPDTHEFTLKIAGAAHFTDLELQQTLSQLSHASSVEFLGRLSDDELEKLYQNATAFCMPSALEGFGIPVIEAMQCGTAVLSSDNSALREVVKDAGILVNTFDAEQWSLAMHQITTTYADWSTRSLERSKKYDWKTSASLWVERFNKLER